MLELMDRAPRKKYERIGQMMIRPLLVRQEKSAYDLARLFYAQYADLDFEKDLKWYMRNGFVTVRPHLFGMVCPIEYGGKRGWYIRIVIGDLGELISCLPCRLDFIAFCRNNQADKMVIVDFETFLRKAAQFYGYTKRAT
jgi:hypothetical protein